MSKVSKLKKLGIMLIVSGMLTLLSKQSRVKF